MKLDFGPENIQESLNNFALDPFADAIEWTIPLEDWSIPMGTVYPPYVEGVVNLEFDSAFMIHNQQEPIILIFRIIILNVILVAFALLLMLLKKCKGCRDLTYNFFFFGVYLRIYLEAILFLTFCSMADIDY